jgi:NTP pyrophosphatase (non-canonical NTP hydrolase)
MTMSLNDYQKLVMRTAKSADGKREALLNIGLGLTGEAGEVADLIKKNAFHGHGLDNSKLISECGDVLFYLAWLADTLDVTFEHIADNNIRKLQKRYPEGFSEERSINRIEQTEGEVCDGLADGTCCVSDGYIECEDCYYLQVEGGEWPLYHGEVLYVGRSKGVVWRNE